MLLLSTNSPEKIPNSICFNFCFTSVGFFPDTLLRFCFPFSSYPIVIVPL
ncbi:hypothetical protein [uncultured Eubacterium sp.]|nr:hypothetical protein [uncultured Eubacterium sp.]